MAFGDTGLITTSAAVQKLVGPIPAGHGSITLSVVGTGTVYVSNNPNVSTSNGFTIVAGPPTSIDIITNGQTLYALASGGTPTLSYMLGA